MSFSAIRGFNIHLQHLASQTHSRLTNNTANSNRDGTGTAAWQTGLEHSRHSYCRRVHADLWHDLYPRLLPGRSLVLFPFPIRLAACYAADRAGHWKGKHLFLTTRLPV